MRASVRCEIFGPVSAMHPLRCIGFQPRVKIATNQAQSAARYFVMFADAYPRQDTAEHTGVRAPRKFPQDRDNLRTGAVT